MSTDLLDQLARYGADHRDRQAPVGREEILARVRELADTDDELPAPERIPTARPWIPFAAAAAVIALVAGLVLATIGRDASEPSELPGTDFIRTTEPSTPRTTVEPTPAPTTSTTSTTTPDGEPEATPVTVPAIQASASTVDPVAVAGAPIEELARGQTLGAWDDGFLFVSVVGGIQMSVELSDEMFARFPPEVREAYPEQLGGPLGEIIATLQEDGLLDEVQAALEADPELEAAVMSGSVTPVELVGAFTTDGENWTRIDVTAPTDMEIEDVFIVEDRLVAVGMPPPGLTPTPFRTMIVASTEDLSDWSVQTVPEVVETIHEVSIAANGDGWVAHVEPDLCRVDRDGQGVFCSWPPEPRQGDDVGEGPPLTWAAPWGGEPVALDGPVAEEGVTVTALSTGFLAQHDAIEFSSDGVTWTTLRGTPQGIVIGGAVPLEDGSTLVFASGATCETERYVVDRSVQRWERVDLEIEGAGTSLMPDTGGLSEGTVGVRSVRSAAVIVDDRSGPNVSIGVIERDDLRLTRTDCSVDGTSRSRYELVDVSSGAVISAEEASRVVDGSRPVPDWQPFEHLVLSDDGSDDVLLDPETGEELLSFSRGEMSVTDIGFGGSEDVWMITTTDGREWLVDDLSDLGGLHFVMAARNGDAVLVVSGDEGLRYELASR